MNPKPTIRMIAKLAGVSFSTVSLALRNHSRIRPEVREEIQRLAAEVGYKSDPIVAHLLARLRSNRTITYQSSLAFLCIDEDPEFLMKITTFNEFFIGSQERASHLGYNIEKFLLPPNQGLTPKRLFTILKARNIRGLLVVDTLRSKTFLRTFDSIWRNSASVFLGIRPTYPYGHFVLNDHFATTKQAIAEAFELGYRRPRLCIPQQVDDWVENRFSGGFQMGLTKFGAQERTTSFNLQFNRQKFFNAWIKKEKPDVLLILDKIVVDWLLALNLKVPRDIGIIQLDSHAAPAWAGMQQYNKEVGRTAVDILIGQLHRSEFGIPLFQSGMMIASAWVKGPTVRIQEVAGKVQSTVD